jgi:hypothetical protein
MTISQASVESGFYSARKLTPERILVVILVTLSNVLTSVLNQKKNAPQVISPPIQQLLIVSDGQISRLAARVVGNFDSFVIGAAHIILKIGQAAYGEFIIVSRTALA